MDRTLLKKIGKPLQRLKRSSTVSRECYLISYDGIDIVGVALYYNAEEKCTVAILKDSDGMKVTIGHFAKEYYVTKEDFIEICKIYDEMFS